MSRKFENTRIREIYPEERLLLTMYLNKDTRERMYYKSWELTDNCYTLETPLSDYRENEFVHNFDFLYDENMTPHVLFDARRYNFLGMSTSTLEDFEYESRGYHDYLEELTDEEKTQNIYQFVEQYEDGNMLIWSFIDIADDEIVSFYLKLDGSNYTHATHMLPQFQPDIEWDYLPESNRIKRNLGYLIEAIEE